MADQPFTVAITCRVRYAETDAMRIVHHAAYIVYLEEGRSEYMRQRGASYAEFEREGYFLVVTEMNVKYLKAAHYDDELTVRCWVTELRSRLLTFSYEIIHRETGERILTGSSKHICTDHHGNIARIPDKWQKWIRPES